MAVILVEFVREAEGDYWETGVVVGATFVVAAGRGLEFLCVFQDMLAFGTMNVADAGIPACRFERLA